MVSNFKQKTERDPKYLAWIRTQRCVLCGRGYGIEAHHAYGNGMSIKCSDYEAVPLCVTCHTGVHRAGSKSAIPNLEAIICRLRGDYETHNDKQKEES